MIHLNHIASHARRVLLICLVLALSVALLSPVAWGSSAAPQVYGLGAILMDYDTGEIYYAKNADLARPVASMTKVMSAYLVFEELAAGRLSWNSYVIASAYAARVSNNPYYSGYEQLKAGAGYTVDSLLQLVFTASCNGAVIALAEHIAGSEAAFVKRMNAKAAELGLNAHYADCCGLVDTGNAVSPRAMALLAQRLIRDYPQVLNYSSLKSTWFLGKKFTTTNTLLETGSFAGIDGLKTGSTAGAGYCFTATASRNGRRMIAVTMHTSSRAVSMGDCSRLMEYGFAQREQREQQEAALRATVESVGLDIRSESETLRPGQPAAFTLRVSGMPDGVSLPCMLSWSVNWEPIGEAVAFTARNGAEASLSWTPGSERESAEVRCTLSFANGALRNQKAAFPVSLEKLRLNGLLSLPCWGERTGGELIKVLCRLGSDQTLTASVAAGWYLDGESVPGFQTDALELLPAARSQVVLRRDALTPGVHEVEFRWNTDARPGVEPGSLRLLLMIQPEDEG